MSAPFSSKPPLNLYVVWHPHFSGGPDPRFLPFGAALADSLYRSLCLQPRRVMSPGLGIPVYFRTSEETAAKPVVPPPIDLDRADHTVVVLLIDTKLAMDEKWVAYARDIARRVLNASGDRRHLVLPILFLERNLAPPLGNTQNVDLYDEFEAARRPVGMRLRVMAETCRLLLNMKRDAANNLPLSPLPLDLFVSHAKYDGEPDAIDLLAKIKAAKLGTFFDKEHIASGYDYSDEILSQVQRSAVVALQTDAYASRPWCRREILKAKEHGRPIVVVHLTKGGEDRSFPYLGNVPTLRWTGTNQHEIIAATVREYLRGVYNEMRFRWLEGRGQIPANARHLMRPPELLDGVMLRRRPTEAPVAVEKAEAAEKAAEKVVANPESSPPRQLVLYPDPPLGNEEVETLAEFFPELIFATPTTLAGPNVLKGYDLRLMSWGDGTGVPTSGTDLVIVGTDNNDLLHIRIFDHGGNRVTDTDETNLPPEQAPAISTLKMQFPGLLPPYVLTDTENEQVLEDATSIVGQPLLKVRVVALSLSETSESAGRGFTATHLYSASCEVARHIFSRGGGVAYGGDLRPTWEGGFTQELFQLVGSYKSANVLPNARVTNYLAWPIYLSLVGDDKRRLELKWVAQIKEIPPPDSLAAKFALDLSRKPEGGDAAFIFARCLTEMRKVMTSEVHARIVMGGRVTGYAGKYPGILEEAHLALLAGQPLYLLGEFGGCARAIAEAVRGNQPVELTEAYQTKPPLDSKGWGPGYARLIGQYAKYKGDSDVGDGEVDYVKIVKDFNDQGIPGLNNGLNRVENEELFTSDNLDRIVYLLMKGLTTVFG